MPCRARFTPSSAPERRTSISTVAGLTVRPAREADLAELQRIVNLAFAAQFGLPSPEAFGDRMSIAPRWRADAQSVLAAEIDGRLVGSNVVTAWGRLGWFGPLTVHPEFWNRGIAQALLAPTMQRFVDLGTTVEALYTLPSSPKHIALYQRYGYWPRRLTAMLARPPEAVAARSVGFASLDAAARSAALHGMRTLCARLLEGFDVTAEVIAVAAQGLGETLVLTAPDGAVQRLRDRPPRSRQRSRKQGSLSVKFGAAADAPAFRALLDAILAYGAAVGVERVVVAINTAREGAYRAALERGFRVTTFGVAMVRGGAAYDDPGAWVIEDHR